MSLTRNTNKSRTPVIILVPIQSFLGSAKQTTRYLRTWSVGGAQISFLLTNGVITFLKSDRHHHNSILIFKKAPTPKYFFC